MPTVDRGDQLCDSGAAAFIRCHTYAICIRRNVITALGEAGAKRLQCRRSIVRLIRYCIRSTSLHYVLANSPPLIISPSG